MLSAAQFLVLAAITAVYADYATGPWRTSLDGPDSCWTDRTCNRVLTTAHGGEWNISFPYDSMPAFEQAFIDGADAIKGGLFITNRSSRLNLCFIIINLLRFSSS